MPMNVAHALQRFAVQTVGGINTLQSTAATVYCHATVAQDVGEVCAPALCLVVGAGDGSSVIAWASRVDESVIVCIDTWLGSVDTRINADHPTWGTQMLAIQDGYPQLHGRFCSNVRAAGIQERVYPIPLPPQDGIELVWRSGITPDVVYLDFNHEYASLYRDLNLIWGCFGHANPPVVCGDDYHDTWPSVQLAVDSFARTHHLTVLVKQASFVILPPLQDHLRTRLLAKGWVATVDATEYRSGR